jgi:hypothetical protein
VGAIRARVVPSQTAAQFVTRQYVDGAISGSDSLLLHKTGDESVTGVKSFAVSPTAPTPGTSLAIANKTYVDTTVNAAVGAISTGFVAKGGDTMTGPLLLPADPVSNNQAADRHYVDAQASVAISAVNQLSYSTLPGHPQTYRFIVNAVVDCGLVGDGVTNDGPALQACINAHPGQHVLLPKMASTPSGTDYFIGSAITLNGNGMTIEGEGGGYAGGTTLQFPAGTKGFIVNNATCQGCSIRNLNLIGGSPFTTTSKNQCVIPSTMEGASGSVTGTSTDDAIQVGADFTRLENLYINSWGRHGVYFTGGDIAGTFADDVSVNNVISYGNRGDGFYGHGGDFNAGHFTEAIAYNNQFWGIHDSGFLGNTWAQPQVTGNHQDNSGAAGSTTAVSISRSSSVVTVANFTAHGLVVGNAIVISGSSDATYNGTWFVASVVDANTITFSNGAGATSGVTANARISTCTEAWTASGLDGGSYKAVGAAQQGAWINPYAELSNGGTGAKFAGGNLVLNGNPVFDTAQQNYHYSVAGFHGSSYSFTANDSRHQNVKILIQMIQTIGSTLWSFIDSVNDTED